MNKYTAQAHQEMTAMYEARLFFNGASVQEVDWAVKEEQKCHQKTADFEREVVASLPYIVRGDEKSMSKHRDDMIQLSKLKGHFIASREYRMKVEFMIFGSWDL